VLKHEPKNSLANSALAIVELQIAKSAISTPDNKRLITNLIE
jgi:hypothetical protein